MGIDKAAPMMDISDHPIWSLQVACLIQADSEPE